MDHDNQNAKRLARNERKREMREKQKLEDPDCRKQEYEKRQEQRKKQKLEDPDCRKQEYEKRQEQRKKQKLEDPISHEEFLESEKQKSILQKREIFSQIYDKLFEENKPYPTPVSKSEWQILKNTELNFVFDERFFPEGNTISDIRNAQKDNIIFLREHPFHQLGPSIIFFLKTMVHRPKENVLRKITKEEMDWVFSLDLSDYDKSPKKLSRNYSEDKKKYNKMYHDKILADRKTHNLNIRFMKEDPNRVLSVDDICNNPFVSNFSQKEEYKIQLWKLDKNPSDLEKWKKQREDYEKSVKELSIEYKTEFLKNIK